MVRLKWYIEIGGPNLELTEIVPQCSIHIIISLSESADTKPLCILIPEKLELKVNSELPLVTILGTWGHIFVPAGENEAASCIAI